MRRTAASLFSCVALMGVPPAMADTKETDRLEACRVVVRELIGMSETIPEDLLKKAECVAVIPGVKKAAIGIGARFGYGALSCRTDGGRGIWSPPVMIGLKGGSFGFQIGGQEADLVLLMMNERGIDALLSSKFTLGVDASIAAGPVGRTGEAATDAKMRAEILSYSRSRGIFAGLSLEGASLKHDERATRAVYDYDVSARDVLLKPGRTRVPSAAIGFIDALDEFAPRRR